MKGLKITRKEKRGKNDVQIITRGVSRAGRGMLLRLKRCDVEIHFLFAAAATLMLILDTGGTSALCLASCLAHECGHLLCLMALGENPRKIYLGVFGMRIERTGGVRLSLARDCLAALAGPAVNLLLAGLFAALGGRNGIGAFHKAALVNLGLALFNLLPVETLDGGQALYYILSAGRIGEEKARQIGARTSMIVLIPLICLGAALLVHSGYNFTLLIVSAYLFLLFLYKER